MLVKFWMTRDPATVTPQTHAAEAYRLMQERKFRRLPVLDGEALAGIVTAENLNSILQYYAGRFDKARQKRDFSKIKVENVMTPSPFTVRPDTPVAEAAQLMRERKIGGLPVVEKGRLVGIITESDIFRALLGVLGFGLPGMPLTFLLPHDPAALHEVMQCAKARGLRIHALSVIRDYSQTHCMVLLHVEGEGVPPFLEDLRGRQVEILAVGE